MRAEALGKPPAQTQAEGLLGSVGACCACPRAPSQPSPGHILPGTRQPRHASQLDTTAQALWAALHDQLSRIQMTAPLFKICGHKGELISLSCVESMTFLQAEELWGEKQSGAEIKRYLP